MLHVAADHNDFGLIYITHGIVIEQISYETHSHQRTSVTSTHTSVLTIFKAMVSNVRKLININLKTICVLNNV